MAYYVISYDISVDKRRAKVAKLLEGCGRRVLKSVFECDLNEAEYKQIHKKLLRRLRPAEGDQVRIYRLCGGCFGAIATIGDVPAPERAPDIYVF